MILVAILVWAVYQSKQPVKELVIHDQAKDGVFHIKKDALKD